ncbi:MAG: hypothetical protein AB1801_19515, partial [Chloroflexota bacterium]
YGRLPLTTVERAEGGYKSDWPPLFHLLAGTVGRGIDLNSPPFVKVAQNNPRLQLVVGHDNIKSWRALTTEDPYQSEVLLWYMSRWVTLGCGVAGVIAIYLLVRAIYPARSWLAVGAAALVAFNSGYLNASSVISYEPLLGLLVTFFLLVLYYTLHYPDHNRLYLALGVLMGLSALTKYTVLPALPLLPLLVIWLGYRRRWGRRLTIWRVILVSIGLLVTFGVWVLYMLVFFNRISELGWLFGLLNPFLVGDGSDDTSLRLAGAITGGRLGGSNSVGDNDTFLYWVGHTFGGYWSGGWPGWVLWALLGLALVGLVRGWRSQTEERRLWLVMLVTFSALYWLLPFLRYFLSGQAATGMGQHVLFSTAAAMVLLLVMGLNHWLKPVRLAQLLGLIVAVLLWQRVMATAQLTASALPIQTVPLADPEQTIATFGDMALIGYTHRLKDQLLELTLNWRADQLLNEDYKIELTLLDPLGQPRSRWQGQPLNGAYPTRAWSPGDRIRHVVELPLIGLPPGDYRIQLRVLGEGGALAPVKTSELAAADNNAPLDLGRVTLPHLIEATFETVWVGDQEIGYIFWSSDPSTAQLPVYGERATIAFSTRNLVQDDLRLSLVGPDEQPRPPIDHTGHTYLYYVEPNFAGGDYRLRFEQLNGERVTAQAETQPLVTIETEERQFALATPISNPVSANFAGYVSLLGYDLPQRRVQPGDVIPVTLYWQARRTIGADLIMFNHLLGQDQQIWGGRDRKAREIYSTILWAPGEIVTDAFNLQVDPNAPAGIYQLLVGLYLPVGQAAVSVPLVQNGELSQATSVSLGPVKVGRTSPGFTMQAVEPQVMVNQLFGDGPHLTLLGYDLTRENGQPIQVSALETNELKLNAQSLKLTLYWRSELPLPVDYTTFVHLRNEAGEIVTQMDRPPLGGDYPTSLWDPGEIIADEIELPLPVELPAGGYQLVLGLYDFQSGQRLTVPDNPADELVLFRTQD